MQEHKRILYNKKAQIGSRGTLREKQRLRGYWENHDWIWGEILNGNFKVLRKWSGTISIICQNDRKSCVKSLKEIGNTEETWDVLKDYSRVRVVKDVYILRFRAGRKKKQNGIHEKDGAWSSKRNGVALSWFLPAAVFSSNKLRQPACDFFLVIRFNLLLISSCGLSVSVN